MQNFIELRRLEICILFNVSLIITSKLLVQNIKKGVGGGAFPKFQKMKKLPGDISMKKLHAKFY